MAEHGHGHPIPVGSKLKFGIMLSGAILVVEVVGGILSSSLALLSDAGHVFTDIIALSLSWYAVRQAERPSHHGMTFGYHRVGVIVALVNAVSIFAIAVFIFFEAYQRWQDPPEVNSLIMLAAATLGLGVNVFIAFWLRAEQRTNINVRSAFWHVMGDALASVGVIIAGLVIMFTGLFVVDPLVSVFIGFIIALAAWRIFKEAMKVILEATPHQVDVPLMIDVLKRMKGVKGIHDVHVWSISPEIHAMSCHLLVDNVSMDQAAAIRSQVEDVLRRRFDIEHSALQMECHECTDNDLFCTLTLGTEEEGQEEHKHEGEEHPHHH